MADVFLSYRNTTDRRAIVRRLATILRAYEVSVWWDYGLEAGESYRAQIMTELASARIVAPLWCVESVRSQWVRMEAELGKDKLVPARLQKVAPPDAFEAIQAADLTGWDGTVSSPRLQAFVRRICERLGRSAAAPTDLIEELSSLPLIPPLLETVQSAPSVASASVRAHDYAFWERQWEKQGASTNLVALRAIAKEAPSYFADQARVRISEVEAEQHREEQERERKAREAEEQRRARDAEAARRQADGGIKVDAEIIHGAPDGWFKPGAGKSEWFKDLDIGPEMVVVPAGEFSMGSNDDDSETPPHKVTINEPFAVGRFAVTFNEWDAAGLPHRPEDGGWGRAQRPVIQVSWENAKAYTSWLSRRTGKDYRLLSEAEWEYCCRAGTTTKYAFGDHITLQQAQFSAKRTIEVGKFPPNAWGLYDMHGNVYEWCEDLWHPDYRGAPLNGSVWQGGVAFQRVLRGGTWSNDNPNALRSAHRYWSPAIGDLRNNIVGFRVARTFPYKSTLDLFLRMMVGRSAR